MATITISLAGSGIMNNTSKQYTISDGDLQALLNWAQSAFNVGAGATNPQILLAWLQWWIGLTKGAIQTSQALANQPALPPQVGIV